MIKICGDNMYPPFEYYDSDGNAVGFNVDLIKAIDRNTDIFRDGYEIELLPWLKIEDSIIHGEKDLIEGISITKKREENITFSKSIIEVSHYIYVLSSNSEIYTYKDLKDKEILAQFWDPICGLRAEDTLIKDTFFKLKLVKDLETGFRLLSEGVGDVIISPEPTAEYFSHLSQGKLSLRPIARLYWTDYAIGVKKGNNELINRINEGLDILSSIGELDKLKQRWFGETYTPEETEKQETVSIGLMEIDQEGNVIYANEKANSIIGCNNIFLLDDNKTVDSIRLAIKTLKQKAVLYTKDGIVREEYCLEVFPRAYLKDEIVATVVLHDLVEEKQNMLQLLIENKMAFSEKVMEKIFSRINNSYTTVKMFADLLPENIDNGEFIRKFERYVPSALEEIGKFYKVIQVDTKAVECERIELLRAINYAITDFEKGVVSNVKFTRNIEEGIYILFDKIDFYKVINNVLANCVESNCTIVLIEAELVNGKVRIKILDDGCGISASALSNVFDCFYTTKKNHDGLGLYVAYRIVKKNEGEIQIRNNMILGTCVEITVEGGI